MDAQEAQGAAAEAAAQQQDGDVLEQAAAPGPALAVVQAANAVIAAFQAGVGGQQQQAQQPAVQEPPAAAAGAAAAEADAEAEGGGDARAAKRPRLAPDFSYEPEAECDLIVRCADGKRLGCHRLIVLRVAGLLRDLLDACAGENEITVPEESGEFRSHLLDLLYDRSVQLKPEIAMRVHQLADKYEAPSLMQACRLVFASHAFELRIRQPGGGASLAEGHADLLDVLALASKHDYPELLLKCTNFMQQQCGLGMATTLASSVKGGSQLADLRQCDMFKVMVAFAECVKAMHEKMHAELANVTGQLKELAADAQQLTKQAGKKQAAYLKLLASYNRLIAKCEKNGVTWHKEDKKKGGKKEAAAAPAAAAPLAAGAAQPAAFVPDMAEVNALMQDDGWPGF